MEIVEAIGRLRLLQSSRRSLIGHAKRKRVINPSEKAMTISMYERDIKALEIAIDALEDKK